MNGRSITMSVLKPQGEELVNKRQREARNVIFYESNGTMTGHEMKDNYDENN